MTEKPQQQVGFAHCVHHNIHFEWCYSLEERFKVIKQTKPPSEHAVRLANLWLFPVDRLPADWQKILADWQQAAADWQQAAADRQKAAADRQKAAADRQKTLADWQQAAADRQKALADWQKADADWRKGIGDIFPLLPTLHDALVAEGYVCTWNGKGIFTPETTP